MNEQIYERLKSVAHVSGVTYYGVIAPFADLDMSREQDRAEIGRLLGEISTHEHEQGRPLLSAVVVRQIGGRPGQGFYALAQQLGVMAPGQNEEEFWQEEVRRVHEQWRSH